MARGGVMPYSNGATLRFLIPAVLRGSQKNVCRITRVSISADSVYYDDSDDSGTSSVTPIAYRPVSSIDSTDGGSMDDDNQSASPIRAVMEADPVRVSDREPSASAGSDGDVEDVSGDSSVASRRSSAISSGSINVSYPARAISPAGENVQTVIEPGLQGSPVLAASPVAPSPSQSPVSGRSWSVSISTASSDEIEYDNYADDTEDDDEDASDLSGASPRRPRQPAYPVSPFDFGGIAAPARSKGSKVSSAGRKRGKSAAAPGTERASSTSPVGSSTNARGSTVIRLVPASVDIFQTLLDLGPAPRSRSSSTGNANGGGSISGGSRDGVGTARSERSLRMPTPTEEEQAKGAGAGGGAEGSECRPMASLAVPEMTDDDQTSDEVDEEAEDELENAEAGLLNLARLGCRVQFASTVVDNERSVGADGSGAGPSGVARMSE
ncbi:dentin sialophosphoprotein-like [Anopheles marshallii]|uniref:dentin sialophosphoprotein-like n=1 Tax=Anopheles marshallii TaxID=1521116 RepID=UPI00237B9D6F|nr:dentin sialophosphoprotein-like [Anopheles marshallii]